MPIKVFSNDAKKEMAKATPKSTEIESKSRLARLGEKENPLKGEKFAISENAGTYNLSRYVMSVLRVRQIAKLGRAAIRFCM